MKALGFGVLASIAFLLGCYRDIPRIHFIVPNDFQGEIQFVLDPNNGTRVPLKDNEYRIEVPHSAIMRLTSFKCFRQEHSETATYANGKRIPPVHETWEGPEGESPTVGADAVVFRGISETQRNNEPPVMKYYVGSTNDFHEWRETQAP